MGACTSAESKRKGRVKPVVESALDSVMVNSVGGSSASPDGDDAAGTGGGASTNSIEERVTDGLIVRAPRAQTDAERLLAAAKTGDISVAETIFASSIANSTEEAAGHHLANCRGMWGSTPLIVAAMYGSSELALRLLRDWNADPNLLNDKGGSALLHACIEANEELARACLAHGASVDPSPVAERLRDEQLRLTPLHAASINGSSGVVRALLEAGADINRRISIDPSQSSDGHGDTPIGCAIQYAQAPVVRLLLERGASCAHDIPGNSAALDKTTRPFRARLLAAFRKANAAPDLDEAIAATVNAYPEPARSVDVAGLDTKGCTALHAACRGKLVSTAEELVRCGADVNVANVKGLTPLLLVCQQNGPLVVKIAKLLIDAGADIAATDVHGRDATAFANKTKSTPLLELLTKATKKEL